MDSSTRNMSIFKITVKRILFYEKKIKADSKEKALDDMIGQVEEDNLEPINPDTEAEFFLIELMDE